MKINYAYSAATVVLVILLVSFLYGSEAALSKDRQLELVRAKAAVEVAARDLEIAKLRLERARALERQAVQAAAEEIGVPVERLTGFEPDFSAAYYQEETP